MTTIYVIFFHERQYWGLYQRLTYFYRPLSWGGGSWVFNIYIVIAIAITITCRPSCYDSYEGSNWALRLTSARSPYWGISFDFRFGGMRDSYVRYYNTPISVQPYQREPLIILDSRYGGNSRSGYDNQRYGYSNNGYYVSPSSRYYGYDYGSRNYGVQQRRVDLYERTSQ